MARLQGSVLTSNAATITNSYTVNYPNVTISRVDDYTCSASLRYTNDNSYSVDIDYFGVNTSYSRAIVDQFRLQYAWWYTINGGTRQNDTVWTDCANISYTSIHLEPNEQLTILCWFHGESQTYNLDRTKFGKTELFFHLTYREDVSIEQTTAIPPEWFDNTTQTYQTVTTVSIPVEYDDLVGTIPPLKPDIGGTPPNWFEQYNPLDYPWFIDVLVSFQDWFDMVTLVAGQMKIFWVFGGFVIIGLLLAWLLH